MIILLIGPSGVGKTTLGRYAERKLPNFKLYDLDDEVGRPVECSHDWQDRFFDDCCKKITEIEETSQTDICLIDVGAGVIHSEKATKDWLDNYTSITIYAPPEQAHSQWIKKKGPRDYDEYKDTEHSLRRKILYESASRKFNVIGLNENEAEQRFLDFFKEDCLIKLYNHLLPEKEIDSRYQNM